MLSYFKKSLLILIIASSCLFVMTSCASLGVNANYMHDTKHNEFDVKEHRSDGDNISVGAEWMMFGKKLSKVENVKNVNQFGVIFDFGLHSCDPGLPVGKISYCFLNIGISFKSFLDSNSGIVASISLGPTSLDYGVMARANIEYIRRFGFLSIGPVIGVTYASANLDESARLIPFSLGLKIRGNFF